MKKYWLIFILVTTTCIAGLAILIFINFFRSETITLNIDKMKEADIIIQDTASNFSIDAVYPADNINNDGNVVPWADVYVCTSLTKQDSLSGHTKFILLDINTKVGLSDIKDIYNYSAIVKPEVFRKCRVKIPPGMAHDLKNYRYKLVDVKLDNTGFWD